MLLIFPLSQLSVMMRFGSDGNVHPWEVQPSHFTSATTKSPLALTLVPFTSLFRDSLTRPGEAAPGMLQGSSTSATGSCEKWRAASHDKSHQWDRRGRHAEAGKCQSWGHPRKLHPTTLCAFIVIHTNYTHICNFFDRCHTQCQQNLSCAILNLKPLSLQR